MPAEDFILAQNIKMQAKIFRPLELLEIKGNDYLARNKED